MIKGFVTESVGGEGVGVVETAMTRDEILFEESGGWLHCSVLSLNFAVTMKQSVSRDHRNGKCNDGVVVVARGGCEEGASGRRVG